MVDSACLQLTKGKQQQVVKEPDFLSESTGCCYLRNKKIHIYTEVQRLGDKCYIRQ